MNTNIILNNKSANIFDSPSNFVSIIMLRKTINKSIFSIQNKKTVDKYIINNQEKILFYPYFQRISDYSYAINLFKKYKDTIDFDWDYINPINVIFGKKIIKNARKRMLRSKIHYQTGFSISAAQDHIVYDPTLSLEYIIPDTLFLTITNIFSPTIEELLLSLKILTATKNYGKNKFEFGKTENKILYIVTHDAPEISCYELIYLLSQYDQCELTEQKISEIIIEGIENYEQLDKISLMKTINALDLNILFKRLIQQSQEYYKQLEGEFFDAYI